MSKPLKMIPFTVSCENSEPNIFYFIPTKKTFWSSARVGLKPWMMIWGITVVSVLIPIVHFITVPVGILAGPIVGIKFYLKDRKLPLVEDATFPCPICQLKITIKYLDRLNRNITCSQCRKISEINFG